jgi:pSer/pThr/pTyr-binding forkhead associated (FHA) protein
MAELIIEVLTRNGVHVAYHKAERLPYTIGRAFDNDLILPDPGVSPRHLTIEQGTEGWVIIDHGTTNGTLLARGRRIEAPVEVPSGTQLLLGRTVIRILDPLHGVPEAQSTTRVKSPVERFAVPAISIASVIVTGAAITLSQFLNVAKETKTMALLANALPLLFFPFLWAGIWASAGFIVRRRANFGMQLIIANGAFVLILVITELYGYLDYFTSSVKTADIFQYACMALLSSLVLFRSLKTATGNAGLRRMLLAFVLGTGIVAAIAFTEHADSFEKNLSPKYSQTLKPPYAKIAKSVSLDAFMKESEKLFKGKDKNNKR